MKRYLKYMTTNKMEQNEIDLRIRLRELASQRGWDNFEVRDLQDKVIENVLDDFVFFYEEGKADGIKIQILNEVHTPAQTESQSKPAVKTPLRVASQKSVASDGTSNTASTQQTETGGSLDNKKDKTI